MGTRKAFKPKHTYEQLILGNNSKNSPKKIPKASINFFQLNKIYPTKEMKRVATEQIKERKLIY
jgi:hypothetical protein